MPKIKLSAFEQVFLAVAVGLAAIMVVIWALPRLGFGPDNGPNADISGLLGSWNADQSKSVLARENAHLECVVEMSHTADEATITVVSSAGDWWQYGYSYVDNGANANPLHSWNRFSWSSGMSRNGHDYKTALGGKTWPEFKVKSGVDCKIGSNGAISIAERHL